MDVKTKKMLVSRILQKLRSPDWENNLPPSELARLRCTRAQLDAVSRELRVLERTTILASNGYLYLKGK